jgi:hypothetical protein
MGAGVNVQGSFSKGLVQTIWFPLNEPQTLQHNLDVTNQFIASLSGRARFTNPGYMANGIDGSEVLAFLRAYHFVPQRTDGGPGLDAEELVAYIERQIIAGELRSWSVAVKSQQDGRRNTPPPIKLGGLPQAIIPVIRNRHSGTEYKVGVISDPPDLVADLPAGTPTDKHRLDVRFNPLIVIYPIWQDSRPLRPSRTLVPLFDGIADPRTVIGLAIDFPESRSEPYSYVAQLLS